jgi:hypothetical protein
MNVIECKSCGLYWLPAEKRPTCPVCTLRASLARAEAELARAKPVVEAAIGLRRGGVTSSAWAAFSADIAAYLASEPKEPDDG